MAINDKFLSWDFNQDIDRQIDYFSNQTPYVADAFRNIKNERSWLLDSFKTDLFDYFDAFQKSTNPSFNAFLNQSWDIATRILPWLTEQEKLVRQKFWPEWEMVQQANNYFKNLQNAINNAVSWGVASAWNQAIRTWASQSAINQAINQARSQWLWDLNKIQWEKIAQQQALLNNYIQLQDALRQQRFNYEDQLLRNPLLQLNQNVNQLGTALLSWLQNITWAEMNQFLANQARAWWGGWGWNSNTALQQLLQQMSWQWQTNKQEPIIATWFEADWKPFKNEIVWTREKTYTTADWKRNQVFFDVKWNDYIKWPNWFTPVV